MKIRITNFFENIVAKVVYNMPSIKLERKIDAFKEVADRNKLVDSTTTSIDEVVQVVKTKKIKYHLYF